MLKDNIKTIRKELGLTQEEFAKRIGISRSYYCDIERGRLKGTNVSVLSKISDVTGISIETLLGKTTIDIKQYETLDTAINMLIDSNMVDSEGNFLNKNAEIIMLDILKKEIKLKLSTRAD